MQFHDIAINIAKSFTSDTVLEFQVTSIDISIAINGLSSQFMDSSQIKAGIVASRFLLVKKDQKVCDPIQR